MWYQQQLTSPRSDGLLWISCEHAMASWLVAPWSSWRNAKRGASMVIAWQWPAGHVQMAARGRCMHGALSLSHLGTGFNPFSGRSTKNDELQHCKMSRDLVNATFVSCSLLRRWTIKEVKAVEEKKSQLKGQVQPGQLLGHVGWTTLQHRLLLWSPAFYRVDEHSPVTCRY